MIGALAHPVFAHPRGVAPPASTVDQLRQRGVAITATLGWVAVLLLTIAAVLIDNGSTGPLLAFGIAVNLAPTAMMLRRRYDAEARAIVGTLAAATPALLVYLLRGHPWQMDGHMYFFVALAGLTMLCDWRPIAVASALIAAHHLVFEWVAPEWVFAGTGNLPRVLFHALAVGLQLGVLSYITVRLAALLRRQDAVVGESQVLADVAEEERRRASAALAALHEATEAATGERQGRRESERRATAERDAELRVLANEFERTVTSVVKSIEGAAGQLARSSAELDGIAGTAGRDAGDVAGSATEATGEMRAVAGALARLSLSVSTIAVAAQQQDDTTSAALDKGRLSIAAIASLRERAGRIADFVATIRAIAAKTNMLALNATIEAARAGEAGRGFAVVAGEVKGLAGHAAQASDAIAALLAGIEGAIGEAAEGVESVTASVAEVSGAATGIAAAVEDQRADAARIEEGAARAAANADEIEYRIGRVASGAATASMLSAAVRRSADALAADAGALRSSTDSFVRYLRDDV